MLKDKSSALSYIAIGISIAALAVAIAGTVYSPKKVNFPGNGFSQGQRMEQRGEFRQDAPKWPQYEQGFRNERPCDPNNGPDANRGGERRADFRSGDNRPTPQRQDKPKPQELTHK